MDTQVYRTVTSVAEYNREGVLLTETETTRVSKPIDLDKPQVGFASARPKDVKSDA
jgi:hypothetical protein